MIRYCVASLYYTAGCVLSMRLDWLESFSLKIEIAPKPKLTDLNGLGLLDVRPSGAALGLGALPGDDLDVDEGVAGLRDVVDAVVQLCHDAVEAGAYRHRGLVRLDLDHEGGSDWIIGLIIGS